ncbi:hypothetical protein [Methylomonas koyamae]|uniref:hypothetical protein n=1 Tax=Methylomonas koyamae TaxID=702114 RepID=UPI000A7C9E5F|nr:hypothetical protein [Methylomonas koyamae]
MKGIFNWLGQLDNKNRIAVAISILWVTVVPFYLVPFAGESTGPVEHFLWWGLFPLFLYWGRRFWVRKWF